MGPINGYNNNGSNFKIGAILYKMAPILKSESSF